MKLKDKTAIISGGSRGIGGACVELFAQEGANVTIGDVLEADGQALADKLGDKVVPPVRFGSVEFICTFHDIISLTFQ